MTQSIDITTNWYRAVYKYLEWISRIRQWWFFITGCGFAMQYTTNIIKKIMSYQQPQLSIRKPQISLPYVNIGLAIYQGVYLQYLGNNFWTQKLLF